MFNLKDAPIVPVPPFAFVAPLGTTGIQSPWRGRLHKKPWHFKTAAAIPHLNTPETLPHVIELLRWQTERPYIMIFDTGSPTKVCEWLETLRGPDVEIHYIRGGGWCNSSEPVSTAMDCALALCRSPYLFATHSDVFLRRRDVLAWYRERCSPECPVIGYEMSPRKGTSAWQGTPSHTATMFHVPTLREHGVRFNLQDAYRKMGLVKDDTRPEHWPNTRGWPDTETCLGMTLKAAGLHCHLLGRHDLPEDRTFPWARPEGNYERHVDDNLDHVRSYASGKMYADGYHRYASAWLEGAIKEAQARIAGWQGEISPSPQS